MNNEQIKEAFNTWADEVVNEEEKRFAGAGTGYNLRLGFHGGYTAADREWRERIEKLREAIINDSLSGWEAIAELEYIMRLSGG